MICMWNIEKSFKSSDETTRKRQNHFKEKGLSKRYSGLLSGSAETQWVLSVLCIFFPRFFFSVFPLSFLRIDRSFFWRLWISFSLIVGFSVSHRQQAITSLVSAQVCSPESIVVEGKRVFWNITPLAPQTPTWLFWSGKRHDGSACEPDQASCGHPKGPGKELVRPCNPRNLGSPWHPDGWRRRLCSCLFFRPSFSCGGRVEVVKLCTQKRHHQTPF